MTRRPPYYNNRHCIVAFDPDGDMGYGTTLGPFTEERAIRLANDMRAMIERLDYSMELLVLPVLPVGTASPRALVEKINEFS
jgi:hypothetical protein